MKRIMFCTLFTVYLITVHSQPSSNKPLTREEYIQKSKGQKTGAWILLGTGAAALAIAAPGNVSFDILPTLVIGGGLAVLGSIPLFIASAKNKRRANNLSAFFKTESFPSVHKAQFGLQKIPALSIRLQF